MIGRVWKKYMNHILIILTGSMLLLLIFSNGVVFRTTATEGELTENSSEATTEEGDVLINPGSTEGAGAAEGGAEEGAGGEAGQSDVIGDTDVIGGNVGDNTDSSSDGTGAAGEGTGTEGGTGQNGTSQAGEGTGKNEAGEGENGEGTGDGTGTSEEVEGTGEDGEPVEGEEGEEGEEEDLECTCTSLCTAEQFDETCPLCAKNFTHCKYVEPEEEKECTCDKKCEDGEIDLTCEVCAEDPSLCEAEPIDYAAIIHYSHEGENKKAKFLTLAEALNGAKEVADAVHSDGDSNYVPEIEIQNELSISSPIAVENNCNFIIDLKGYRINLETGAYLDFDKSNVTLKDSTAAAINYGGDNTRPGGFSGDNGKLFSGSGSITFNSGYYGISSGTVLSGFSDIVVHDAFLINSSGSLTDTDSKIVVNNGFFVYDSIFGGNEGAVQCPESMILGEMALSIGGYEVRGYGLSTALFKVTVKLMSDVEYYYSNFAESFAAAENLSKTNDGAIAVITINDPVITNVAISQTYTLTGNPEGYAANVQINNINFVRGGAAEALFDGTMFAVAGGQLILNDCSVNGYISESQVAVSSMFTVDSGAALNLVGSTDVGTRLSGNVALLGATASDPAAGVYVKGGGVLRVSGYVVIYNNICYSETANADGGIDTARTNRNLYLDNNAAICVEGTLLRTETFLIGVTMAGDSIDEEESVGYLSTDYYNTLVAAGIEIMDLSSFFMDTSAAYSMEYDFSTNTITWTRGGGLLPEAGVLRLEYILLFIGLIGFIFRAIQSANEERKEIVRYITMISAVCLLTGTFVGGYHVYTERQIIARNNQVVDTLTNSTEGGIIDGVGQEFKKAVKGEDSVAISDDSNVIAEQPVSTEKSIVPIDGRDYIGIIQVEPLGIKLPVLSTYTDADMKTTPCVYAGSRENENLVIVGHNYDSQFGNFNLLNKDEPVTATLTLVDGSKYTYTSKKYENLNPDQIDEMLSGDWDLTLFTCNYSGEKRITIRFDLVR